MMIDVELLKSYVSGKRAFDELFPQFIMRIGETASDMLKDDCAQLEYHPGPVSYRWFSDMFPDVGEPFGHPYWICFGFPGRTAEKQHAGVVFDLSKWPFTYSIGVHLSNELFAQKGSLMSANMERYGMQYRDAGTEHQYNLPAEALAVDDVDAELMKICAKLCEVYRFFCPILE